MPYLCQALAPRAEFEQLIPDSSDHFYRRAGDALPAVAIMFAQRLNVVSGEYEWVPVAADGEPPAEQLVGSAPPNTPPARPDLRLVPSNRGGGGGGRQGAQQQPVAQPRQPDGAHRHTFPRMPQGMATLRTTAPPSWPRPPTWTW